MEKKLMAFLLLLYNMSASLLAQTTMELPLYEQLPIPNSKPAPNREKTVIQANGIEFTTEISLPTLSFFSAKNPNGQAVIVCPGGGYWGAAGDHEGRQVARALNEKGISAFVLKYRVPDSSYCIDPSLAPLQDAQQAIRTLRRNALKYGINPQKIGILGFSAGGHLAATAATHFHFKADETCLDTTSVRPDFAILIYPVISFEESISHLGSREKLIGKQPNPAQIEFFSNEKQVRRDCPPVFLVHAQDDGAVSVANSLEFYKACTAAGVSAELHLYPKGGHGFGMLNPTTKDAWMERLFNWMEGL